jgi:glutamine synthetase
MNEFSYGVGDRGASVRINSSVVKEGKGFFEDRRPASNMDPYIVTSAIADTVILDGKTTDGEMLSHYNAWLEWKKTQPKFNFV